MIFVLFLCGICILGGVWLLISAFRTRRPLDAEQREALLRASLVSAAVAEDNLPAALLVGMAGSENSNRREWRIPLPILALSALLQICFWFRIADANDFVEQVVVLFYAINGHIPAIASITASEKIPSLLKSYDIVLLDISVAYALIAGLAGLRAASPLRPVNPAKGMFASLLFVLMTSYLLYFDHDAAHSRFIKASSFAVMNIGVLSSGLSTFAYAFFSYFRQFLRSQAKQEV
jgi:hypothetical protein